MDRLRANTADPDLLDHCPTCTGPVRYCPRVRTGNRKHAIWRCDACLVDWRRTFPDGLDTIPVLRWTLRGVRQVEGGIGTFPTQGQKTRALERLLDLRDSQRRESA